MGDEAAPCEFFICVHLCNLRINSTRFRSLTVTALWGHSVSVVVGIDPSRRDACGDDRFLQPILSLCNGVPGAHSHQVVPHRRSYGSQGSCSQSVLSPWNSPKPGHTGPHGRQVPNSDWMIPESTGLICPSQSMSHLQRSSRCPLPYAAWQRPESTRSTLPHVPGLLTRPTGS